MVSGLLSLSGSHCLLSGADAVELENCPRLFFTDLCETLQAAAGRKCAAFADLFLLNSKKALSPISVVIYAVRRSRTGAPLIY